MLGSHARNISHTHDLRMKQFVTVSSVTILLLLVSSEQCLAARQGYHSNNAGQSGGGGLGLGNILDGVQLNLLDAKLIGLGYVREDLVRQLCHQATQQLIWEGVRR